MTGPYDDIIDLPHHVSTKHAPMDIADRAAQFSPFAALTGHDAAIRETARLTQSRPELDEDAKQELDRSLRMIQEHMESRQKLSITYFQADEKKAGGDYKTVTGYLKKIDDYAHKLVLEDGLWIPIEDIFSIKF